MKKWLAMALTAVLLTAGTAMAGAGDSFQGLPVVTVLINGVPVQGDAPPVLLGGRTFVPIRAVSETMGASVRWDPDAQAVVIETAGITAPLQQQLAEAQANLGTAQQAISDLESKLKTTEQELASARAELAKAREALAKQVGSGSAAQTLTPEGYAAAVLSAAWAGPTATATIGKGSDCVPECTAWDQTLHADMYVYSKPYLAYGLTNLPVDVLTAPYTFIALTVRTDSKSGMSLDLSGAVLTMDGKPGVKAAYVSPPQLSMKPYETYTVYFVFPVASGQRANLTFASPARTMNLTAAMPPLPEGFATYAAGPAPNADLAPLAAEVKANLETISMAAFPYVDAPASLPQLLKPYAHPVTEQWIRENLGPNSPLLNGKYTYQIVSFSNHADVIAEVKPAAFATRSASGSLIQPVGFIPLNPRFVFEDYNGLFIYPGHAVEVLVVYPRG